MSSDSTSNGSFSESAGGAVRALVESWGDTASATITAGGIATWIAQQQQRQLEQQQRQQQYHQQQATMEAKKKEQQTTAAPSQRRKRSASARQSSLSTSPDNTSAQTAIPPLPDDDGMLLSSEQEGELGEEKGGEMEVVPPLPPIPLVNSHDNLSTFLVSNNNDSGSTLSLSATTPVLSTTALCVRMGTLVPSQHKLSLYHEQQAIPYYHLLTTTSSLPSPHYHLLTTTYPYPRITTNNLCRATTSPISSIGAIITDL